MRKQLANYLKNKTTYNLLILFFLTATSLFQRIDQTTSRVLSSFATLSYGFYLLTKNYQLREENRLLSFSNSRLRESLSNRGMADVPEPIHMPNEFGVRGVAIDYIFPSLCAIGFGTVPLNAYIYPKSRAGNVLFCFFVLLSGALLGLQHYAAHRLRVYNELLKSNKNAMEERLMSPSTGPRT